MRFIAARSVTIAVSAVRGCHRRHLCATCGVAVTVIMLHVVLWVLSSGGRCSTWVSPLLFLRHMWYCSYGQCSACGVEVTIVAPCLVLWALSSGGRCSTWLSPSPVCATCGVTVAVSAARVVSQAPSLCRMWCHRCCHCTVCGVVDTAIGLCECCGRGLCAACGVGGAAIAPRVVLQSLLLCRTWCMQL
jgi:hypothetical protein